jgi:threonine synthase
MPRANSHQRGYTGRNAKVDANQKAIVKALEQIPGVTVVPIGKPLDLLIGYGGITHIVEIKNPNGKDKVNQAQQEFIDTWTGRTPEVARTVDEVLTIIGASVSPLMVRRELL